MLKERTEEKIVKLSPQEARYAEELEKRGISLSDLMAQCLIDIQMTEGYKAMGTEDIELSERILSVRSMDRK